VSGGDLRAYKENTSRCVRMVINLLFLFFIVFAFSPYL